MAICAGSGASPDILAGLYRATIFPPFFPLPSAAGDSIIFGSPAQTRGPPASTMKAAKSAARDKATPAARSSASGEGGSEEKPAKTKAAAGKLGLKRPLKKERRKDGKKAAAAAADRPAASAANSASPSSSRKKVKKPVDEGHRRRKKSAAYAEDSPTDAAGGGKEAGGDANKKEEPKKKKTASTGRQRRRRLLAAAKRRSKTGSGLTRRERQQRAKRGVIYIGHLPVGFSEPQLKGFFSQFGEVCRVRLFRSRKTAQSKGYAFVEFALRDVAAVAAEAMDKYRLFGRTLVCRLTEAGQVNERVFRNSHKPFKRINWPALAAARYNKPEGQRPSAKEVSALEGKLRRKAKRLKELDIEYEVPQLLPAAEDGENHLAKWVKHERLERKAKKAKKTTSPSAVSAAK
ncbi:hypothetical protein Efla_006304 [Eimeria flavescens]